MDILNNHDHYNKFQVIEGNKVSQSTSVSSYVLECKLKKIIRLHSTEEMLNELIRQYDNKDRIKFRIVRYEDLFYEIEQFDGETLRKLVEVHESEGIVPCLIALLQEVK